MSEPEECKDDDLTNMNRVDLKIRKDYEQAFFELSNKQMIELLDQLSSSVNPLNEFAAIACEKSVISLYPYANKAGANSGKATSYDRVLPRMGFPASLLYYIQDTRFLVSFGRRDENGEEDFVFRIKSSSGTSAGWNQKKDGARVLIGGRSLFSLPVRPIETVEKEKTTLLAVYGERVFIESEHRLFCSRLTLLPPDSIGYYPLMMLVCARRNANIWINVNMATYEIVAIKVHGRNFIFPEDIALRWSALQTINTIRETFSDALNGRPDINKDIHVEDLYMVTEDSTYIVKTSHHGKGSFEWKQLCTEGPGKHTPNILHADEWMSPRFPDLILV